MTKPAPINLNHLRHKTPTGLSLLHADETHNSADPRPAQFLFKGCEKTETQTYFQACVDDSHQLIK